MTVSRTLTKTQSGIALAMLSAGVILAGSGNVMAADVAAHAETHSVAHAALLFAIVWFVASLRIGKSDGRWRLGFDPFPVRRPKDNPARH